MKNHYNCIYMYTNKINGKRYIGQTKDFNKRYSSHLNSSLNNKSNRHNLPFHKAIRKYGIENFQIDILVENISTKDELNELEKSFISYFNTLCKNGIGYNVAEGGGSANPFKGKTEEEMEEFKKGCRERNLGKKLSDDHKRKISEANKTMIFTNEHRRKISESKKGKKRSKECKEKIANKKRGTKHSEETKKKMSESSTKKVKVIQMDTENNVIKIWDSIKQASKELNIDNSAISKCCRGKLKQTGGFKWKYIGDEENGNL